MNELAAEYTVLAIAGFFFGAATTELLEQLVTRRHPAVVEGETLVEAAAVVVEAERTLRRTR